MQILSVYDEAFRPYGRVVEGYPVQGILNSLYFTLRSGGKTLVTFVFDSGYIWVFTIPVAFVLSRFTNLPILPLYAICQSLDILKCFIGAWMLKKGSWIQNLTA